MKRRRTAAVLGGLLTGSALSLSGCVSGPLATPTVPENPLIVAALPPLLPGELQACVFTDEGTPWPDDLVASVGDWKRFWDGHGEEVGEWRTGADGCARLPDEGPISALWFAQDPQYWRRNLLDKLGLRVFVPPTAVALSTAHPRMVWSTGPSCPRSLQVVDTRGAPVAGAAIGALLIDGSAPVWHPGETDAEGRLALDIFPCATKTIYVAPHREDLQHGRFPAKTAGEQVVLEPAGPR